MSNARARRPATLAVSLAVAAGMLLAFGLLGSYSSHAAPALSSLDSAPSAGATHQWAFGGHVDETYNCPTSTCSANSTFSQLSLSFYLGWVVIYTATNVSSTQTEFEAQSAINASLSVSAKGCINESATGPCSPISLSASLSGSDLASGFTNVTSTGTVFLSAGTGSPGTVAALAITNAQSTASFNFSGSLAETVTLNGTTENLNANFDLGGAENSGITFSTPLGVLPISPQPGQSWNSTAPFSATGNYTSGYSVSASGDGRSETENHWTSAAVSPSGTLDLNGTDLGATTLYDNYTTPPTTVNAQIISLDFGTSDFVGTHGWLLLPASLYGGALGATSGVGLVDTPSVDSTVTGGELADYEPGVGFVAENAVANASSLGVSSGAGASLNLQAGPEPVSVAEQQYTSITSSSSSVSFPWVVVIVVLVVVVAVAVVMVVILRNRSRRTPPPQQLPTMEPPPSTVTPPPPTQ